MRKIICLFSNLVWSIHLPKSTQTDPHIDSDLTDSYKALKNIKYVFGTMQKKTNRIMDRPFEGGVMFFCFVQNFFFDNMRVRIFIFSRIQH